MSRSQSLINDFGQIGFQMDLASPASSGIYRATIHEADCTSTCASPQAISMRYGGEQALTWNPGPACAVDLYLLLGSATGTSGFQALGSIVPLTLDAYTILTVTGANQPPLVSSVGLLSGSGTTTGVKIAYPPLSLPTLVGNTTYHAFVALDFATAALCGASDAMSVVLVP